MSRARKTITALLAGTAAAMLAFSAAAQTQYPNPRDLPNPYRLDPSWPTLPQSMNGGHWGEVIRVHAEQNGHIWIFHRCFNTVPQGSAVCINRGTANPPILEFDRAGKLLKSFGAGLFAYPHGFTVDRNGNLWVTDVNDAETVLGMSARNSAGVVMGQEVMKLSPDGNVLMTLGKEGVSGNGPDAFDRPTGVAIAPNGDIFVTDGHLPNAHNNGRVLKFSKDGKFIKSWGKRGAAPGDFDEPHDIVIGGSQNHLYVADRRNQRIQVFDLDGNLLAVWKQFGEPSSVFVAKDDTIYVGSGFPDASAKRGEIRGIVVGNAVDGSLKAFIPDPADPDSLTRGTTSSGIAADDEGSIYSADVAAHNLRKYVKLK
jgi:sugar lactone lactonase YvrE